MFFRNCIIFQKSEWCFSQLTSCVSERIRKICAAGQKWLKRQILSFNVYFPEAAKFKSDNFRNWSPWKNTFFWNWLNFSWVRNSNYERQKFWSCIKCLKRDATSAKIHVAQCKVSRFFFEIFILSNNKMIWNFLI